MFLETLMESFAVAVLIILVVVCVIELVRGFEE